MMNYSLLQYLVIYVLWAIVLVVAVGIWRCLQVVTGKSSPTSFPASVPHGPDFYWRMNRAHLNTLENLPLFASLILVAVITGIDSGSFGTLAFIIIVARVAQSLSHIISGGVIAVNVRFVFFLTQLVCQVMMAIECLSKIKALMG